MANDHLAVNDVTAISGRYLAHNHLSTAARAFLASDLFMGGRQLVLPTMSQAALLARANVTYAWWAHKRIKERAEIEAGFVPLVPPRIAKINGSETLPQVSKLGNANGMSTLPAALPVASVSDAQIDDLIAQVGIARVWDHIAAAIG
jgi:hypothetical protein